MPLAVCGCKPHLHPFCLNTMRLEYRRYCRLPAESLGIVCASTTDALGCFCWDNSSPAGMIQTLGVPHAASVLKVTTSVARGSGPWRARSMPGGAGDHGMEGRPALPAAVAGRRRPRVCGPVVPHAVAAARGRPRRPRAWHRRQLLHHRRACCTILPHNVFQGYGLLLRAGAPADPAPGTAANFSVTGAPAATPCSLGNLQNMSRGRASASVNTSSQHHQYHMNTGAARCSACPCLTGNFQGSIMSRHARACMPSFLLLAWYCCSM